MQIYMTLCALECVRAMTLDRHQNTKKSAFEMDFNYTKPFTNLFKVTKLKLIIIIMQP